jgi:uncharacterized protein (TIGR04551 family)
MMATGLLFFLLQQSDAPPIAAPAPPPPTLEDAVPAASGQGQLSLSEWNARDWMLVKPRLSLLELDGYFRWRSDVLRRLDLGNGATWEDTPRYSPQSGVEAERAADYTGANTRLRLEPRINVAEDIQLVTTLDIFDNLVLGSAPGIAAADAVVVKRAYARVTALNEQLDLRFGRMGDHFGLGMLANDGDCLDCDSGDVVDRLVLTFRLAGHLVSPMFDWVGSGPTVAPFGSGQPLDAVTWDDHERWTVRLQRIDAKADRDEMLLRGDAVLNYGVSAAWGRQVRGLNGAYQGGAVAADKHEERRDANVLTLDAYSRYYIGATAVAVEAAFVLGEMRTTALQPTAGGTAARDAKIKQWGLAVEADYEPSGDYAGTRLQLRLGAASGDRAPGFGARDKADSQWGYFRDDQEEDLELKNFQFNPNYHVGLLLFRHLIGTVTDAWYVSPGVRYRFDDKLNGTVTATYAQAMFVESTASCYSETDVRCRTEKDPDASRALGLELDGELAYGLIDDPEGGAFRAALAGGVLFPFGAFRNPTLDSTDQTGSFAWTLQLRLYIGF